MTDIFLSLVDPARSKTDARGTLEILYEGRNVVLKRSFSKQGVFRGLHWQAPPHEQTKLIRVISGRIIDFVFDPTDSENTVYWQVIRAANDWIGIEARFAHGFYALEDTVFEYICDGAYNEGAERSFSIAGTLREAFHIRQPLLSAKDAAAQQLRVGRLSPPAKMFMERE